ncbi:hypothetical protein ACE193_15280 [Bernardetia sp. OM2101]|uniref:hypothetical protein n=1 Tax=Bernardetia sp. OM2101 TaxID=3344876 RepID=UPI0035CF1C3C
MSKKLKFNCIIEHTTSKNTFMLINPYDIPEKDIVRQDRKELTAEEIISFKSMPNVKVYVDMTDIPILQ